MLKGYRTIIWNIANAVVPAMQVVDATYKIPQEWMPYWIMVVLLGNVILRMKTDTPVGKKSL